VIELSSKQAREKCHQTLVAGLRLIRPEERVTAIAAAMQEVVAQENRLYAAAVRHDPAPARRPIHLIACIRDAATARSRPDVKEARACVSPGPPVSIAAETQTVPQHSHRISRIDYRQVRNAVGKLLTCRRKPDSQNGPFGFNRASLPNLACAQLPACPKPPPFLEAFVCDVGSPGTRQVSGSPRRTGGTLIFFARCHSPKHQNRKRPRPLSRADRGLPAASRWATWHRRAVSDGESAAFALAN
jgi:hypothetical protein